MYSTTGAVVGTAASLGSISSSDGLESGLAAQVVCVKQDIPLGQSLEEPDGHGSSQLFDASSKVLPHMKESVSSHVV
jgi:hypothetical protein